MTFDTVLLCVCLLYIRDRPPIKDSKTLLFRNGWAFGFLFFKYIHTEQSEQVKEKGIRGFVGLQ